MIITIQWVHITKNMMTFINNIHLKLHTWEKKPTGKERIGIPAKQKILAYHWNNGLTVYVTTSLKITCVRTRIKYTKRTHWLYSSDNKIFCKITKITFLKHNEFICIDAFLHSSFHDNSKFYSKEAVLIKIRIQLLKIQNMRNDLFWAIQSLAGRHFCIVKDDVLKIKKKETKKEIWLFPMKKAHKPTKKIQKPTWQHINATKNFDNVSRLRVYKKYNFAP